MYSIIPSATIVGMDSVFVHVEVDVNEGMPMFEMVGLLSGEVKEAKERVRIALRNSGYRIPPKRITINMSPANVKKGGTGFDLPIAVGILNAMGMIGDHAFKNILIVGELSLDGQVNGINGILPLVSAAKKQGYKSCIIPFSNLIEGRVVFGIDLIGVSSLQEAVEALQGTFQNNQNCINIEETLANKLEKRMDDFSEINGQVPLKRACEIAMAGMHNFLMIGPKGTGKTMIAKRIPSILPKLTPEESLEISKIYSVSGLLTKELPIIWQRPFRSPHHSITESAMIGGGKIPKPGEISLAHGGVLFLDELPEFKKSVLEMLRQPLEEKSVNIVRVLGNYHYPAGAVLVAAMNPCNCGFYPDRNRCKCSVGSMQRYLGKISSPLLDRIDICAEALMVTYQELMGIQQNETSSSIRMRVEKAHQIQKERYVKTPFLFNSELTSSAVKKYCILGTKEAKKIEQAYQIMGLSARAYYKILKVSRTIADLDQSEVILERHMNEAIYYRMVDKKYWEV